MSRILLFLYSVNASPISIPLRFRDDHQPIIQNVSVPGVGLANSSFDAVLTFEPVSLVRVSRDENMDRSRLTDVHSGDNVVLSNLTRTEFKRERMGEDTLIFLGIGRESFMMEEYQAISMLRNSTSDSGLLVLNDTDAYQFNNSCLPDTISRIEQYPFTRHSWVAVDNFRLVWRRSMGHNSDREMIEMPHYPTSLYVSAQSSQAGIVSLPTSMYDEIVKIISGSGAVRNRFRGEIFTSCNRGLFIDQLPLITISFRDSGGSLALLPEDYIQSIPEARECDLRFTRLRGPQYPFLNFFRIPNTNLHITNNAVSICEAQ